MQHSGCRLKKNKGFFLFIPFWSKSVRVEIMPKVVLPDLKVWSTLAKTWHLEHPGCDPLQIPVEQRRQSQSAKAAYWWASKMEEVPGQPPPAPCDCCGRSTYGWCEGCYCRQGASTDKAYSAVCSDCEQTKSICGLCNEVGISWEMGHQAFRDQNGDHEFLVTGIDGEALQPTALDVTAVALSLGIPPEDLIQQVESALRGSRAAE